MEVINRLKNDTHDYYLTISKEGSKTVFKYYDHSFILVNTVSSEGQHQFYKTVWGEMSNFHYHFYRWFVVENIFVKVISIIKPPAPTAMSHVLQKVL